MHRRSAAGSSWYYSFALANIANGGTSPLIPLFLVMAFSGTLFQVGLVTAVTSIASIPAYIVWGNLTDHLHRRKLFIIEGFAGLAVSIAVMWLSVDFVMFLIANFLLGLLFTASAPAGTALVIEKTGKDAWVSELGKFSKIGGAGYLLGLVAGGLWFALLPDRLQYMRIFFLLLTIISLISAVLASLLIDEGGRHHHVSHHWNTLADIPLRVSERAKYLPSRVGALIRLAAPTSDERKEMGRPLMLYYVVIALFATGFTAFYAVLPNYLASDVGRKFSLNTSYVFAVYVGSSLASTFTYGRVYSLSARFGARAVQIIAAAARIAIIPSFYLILPVLTIGIEAAAVMVSLNALMGVCWAIISVTAQSIVAEMAGPHIKGEAMGFYNAFYGIGSIAGAMIGGIVAQFSGYFSDFLFSSLLVASGIMTMLPVRHLSLSIEKGERGKAKTAALTK